MKIGVCATSAKAAIVKELGYDYIEENLSAIQKMTDESFREVQKLYETLDLPVYSFNNFFPGTITLYGEDSLETIRAYAEVALDRAQALGGKVCVFGSGKARNIGEGVDRAFAEQRFLDVLGLCGEMADKRGILIAVEPLNKNETNYINTVTDGASVARKLGMANVGGLVDFYHFFMENEPDSNLFDAKDTLLHAHLARPNADRLPPKAEDVETLAHWADLLKKINYKGALSIECRFGTELESLLSEATPFVQVFRK